MKKIIIYSSSICLVLSIIFMLSNTEDKRIQQSNLNQEMFYDTIDKDELNLKRLINAVTTETEIVVLDEYGSASLAYTKNSENMFSSITNSTIQVIMDYTATLTIKTNNLQFIPSGDTIKITYDESAINVKAVEITNQNILRDKSLFGKSYSDDEVISIEKIIIEDIKSTIQNDNSIMLKANESLTRYLTDLARELNVKITFN